MKRILVAAASAAIAAFPALAADADYTAESGYVVRLLEVPNGDDTVTLKATIRLRGTHVIVR